MINTRTWWGWGDADPQLAPDRTLDALELPILEGSDPLVQTPGYLATKAQIEATRLDQISDGGGYIAIPRSRLVPGQAVEIGAYWRRARALEQLGPEAGTRIAAFVSGLTMTREGPRLDFYANRPRRTRPAPTAPEAPGVVTPEAPAYQAAPMAPEAPAKAAPRLPFDAQGVRRFFGTPRAKAPPRRIARPWPMGTAAPPLPTPPRPPAHPTPGYVLAPSASPAPAQPPPTSSSEARGAAEASTPPAPPPAPMAGPDEQIAALAQLEALIAYLSTLTPEALRDELFNAPELLELLASLGYIEIAAAEEPTEIGAACCEDCARAEAYERAGAVRIGDVWGDLAAAAAAVDQQVLSPVWEAARDFVPYGAQIDQVHRARMAALEKAAPDLYRPSSAPTNTKEATIRDLQALARGVRRGDAAARATVAQLKERAAAGEADARRRWAAYVAIALDDDRRIAEGRA